MRRARLGFLFFLFCKCQPVIWESLYIIDIHGEAFTVPSQLKYVDMGLAYMNLSLSSRDTADSENWLELNLNMKCHGNFWFHWNKTLSVTHSNVLSVLESGFKWHLSSWLTDSLEILIQLLQNILCSTSSIHFTVLFLRFTSSVVLSAVSPTAGWLCRLKNCTSAHLCAPCSSRAALLCAAHASSLTFWLRRRWCLQPTRKKIKQNLRLPAMP